MLGCGMAPCVVVDEVNILVIQVLIGTGVAFWWEGWFNLKQIDECLVIAIMWTEGNPLKHGAILECGMVAHVVE